MSKVPENDWLLERKPIIFVGKVRILRRVIIDMTNNIIL